jgi:hypothetical protein
MRSSSRFSCASSAQAVYYTRGGRRFTPLPTGRGTRAADKVDWEGQRPCLRMWRVICRTATKRPLCAAKAATAPSVGCTSSSSVAPRSLGTWVEPTDCTVIEAPRSVRPSGSARSARRSRPRIRWMALFVLDGVWCGQAAQRGGKTWRCMTCLLLPPAVHLACWSPLLVLGRDFFDTLPRKCGRCSG